MSTTVMQHGNLADYAPWPWTIRQAGKPHNPVFYIRDATGAEVVRLDGIQARERAELLMELRANYELHRRKQTYQKQYGLPVKQLV